MWEHLTGVVVLINHFVVALFWFAALLYALDILSKIYKNLRKEK
jgi:hypothetical protein